jgi:hypothetical protein
VVKRPCFRGRYRFRIFAEEVREWLERTRTRFLAAGPARLSARTTLRLLTASGRVVILRDLMLLRRS